MTAWLLAYGFRHQWARALSPFMINGQQGQLTVKQIENIALEAPWSEDFGQESIFKPNIEDGVITHRSRMGRYSWSVAMDGSATIIINRTECPKAIEVSVKDGAVTVAINPEARLYDRHRQALFRVLNIFCTPEGAEEIVADLGEDVFLSEENTIIEFYVPKNLIGPVLEENSIIIGYEAFWQNEINHDEWKMVLVSEEEDKIAWLEAYRSWLKEAWSQEDKQKSVFLMLEYMETMQDLENRVLRNSLQHRYV